MTENGFFGLITSSSGTDFFKHGETLGEVLDALNTSTGKSTLYVGIINLSSMELVHLGDRFRTTEVIAKKLILEAYKNAKK